jgi:hypothetical protein
VINRYPALAVLVADLLALAVAFGLQLSPEQIVLIMAVVTSLGQVLVHTRVAPVPDYQRGL